VAVLRRVVELGHVHRALLTLTMGKRKKSTRKPTGPKRREPLGISYSMHYAVPGSDNLRQKPRSLVSSVITTNQSPFDSTEKRVWLS
jgi:hypothetical protein